MLQHWPSCACRTSRTNAAPWALPSSGTKAVLIERILEADGARRRPRTLRTRPTPRSTTPASRTRRSSRAGAARAEGRPRRLRGRRGLAERREVDDHERLARRGPVRDHVEGPNDVAPHPGRRDGRRLPARAVGHAGDFRTAGLRLQERMMVAAKAAARATPSASSSSRTSSKTNEVGTPTRGWRSSCP